MIALAAGLAAPELDLARDGAQRVAGLAQALLPFFFSALAAVPGGLPGQRLHGSPALLALLGDGAAIGARVAALAGGPMRPVRAVLFDKSAEGNNWALGWHQDRTIVVRERRAVAGFGPWSVKQGLVHVEPPFALLEAMVTVRIHLDPVDAQNAPLLIARGSHRLGRIAEGAIEAVVAGSAHHVCLAEVGDVWFYRTPILHASGAATGPLRARRVLQVDYCGQDLPAGLEWLGIG
ncbi:phytanoyl-CoA dioxygenase family protein [Novosphingobium sp. 1949]|uniref:Phytanoyl-CoA dioxygenase family protein n=1 Tax=Novosphingobium organovorum TaxID=2930092 RepID=A0ABT0BG59_9SPHN|nr:phytanoyl-CoA dioxygenase family protein [Novosphingobium organovorum]MCJ2183843.1 phytanoyl-CoA dioxygenase family protein [Novosphingobium organovorum]